MNCTKCGAKCHTLTEIGGEVLCLQCVRMLNIEGKNKASDIEYLRTLKLAVHPRRSNETSVD